MTTATTYILPGDVEMIGAGTLSADIRRRMAAADDDIVMTRTDSKSPSVVIDAPTAELVSRFRAHTSIVSAVLAYSRDISADPRSVLDASYPALKQLIERGFLMPPAGHAEVAEHSGPDSGTLPDDIEIVDAIQVLDDVAVYRGRTSDGDLVAVKLARSPATIAARRICHEGGILAHLAAAGSIPAPRCGEAGDRPFIISQWHFGTDAADAAMQLRAQAGERACHRLRTLCVAIAEAYAELHERGVLHGDVHPRNVIVRSDLRVSIIDFGSARLVNSPPALATRAGVSFYFEPEYAQTRIDGTAPLPTSEAGEQYSVAALLYKLLTGSHYAEFALDARLWQQIVTQAPIPLARHGGIQWPAGERVLRRALSKRPGDRYRDLRTFAVELRKICGTEPAAHRASGEAHTVAREFVSDFVRRCRIDTRSSVRRMTSPWINDGSAGLAYTLLRLAWANEDAGLLAAADTVIAQADSVRQQDAEVSSLYHGRAGVHLVSALIGWARCDVAAVSAAVAQFCSATAGDAVDIFSGKAGKLVGAAHLVTALAGSADEPQVANIRKSLLALGQSLADELDRDVQRCTAEAPAAGEYLGIAHGRAGLLYAALLWAEVTDGPVSFSVESALAGLVALATESTSAAGGRCSSWPQRTGPCDPRRQPQPGWCHGSAGHAFLHAAAYRVLGVDAHLGIAERSALYAHANYTGTGPGICCGLAGQAYAALALWRETSDDLWLERAHDLAMRAVERSAVTSYGDGLYTGMAGIAALCADLNEPEASAMPLFEIDRRW